MIGLGTQDSLEDATDFVADGGDVSFPMYWDETLTSWGAFGVTGQPAAVLVSADGTEIDRWIGAFDEDEVLAKLG